MADHAKQPACANCHYVFLPGEPDEFCPRCGQQNHDINIGFGHVVEEFLEGVFHFDGKVFRTAGLLLFKPGQLTKRFLAGHRVPYVPPIRLYVFISFLFFALLALLRGHGGDEKRRIADTRILSGSVVEPSISISTGPGARERDSILASVRQQVHAQIADTLISKKWGADPSINITGLSFPLAEIRRLPEDLSDSQVDSLIRSKGGQPGFFTRRGVRAVVRWRDVTWEEAIHQALRGASILLFLLMPLAALLLKGVYFRQHRHYVSHLVFTVHVHCFMFVFLAILLLLEKAHLPGSLSQLLLLWPLLYFVVALRVFYQQSWLKTVGKSVLLSLAYGFTMLLAAMVVFAGGLLYF